MSIVLPISYFGPVQEYALLKQNDSAVYELEEHFVKQSYRNRCEIYGANGQLRLTVPLVLKSREKTAIKDIQISNTEKWQSQHWKAIVSSYKNSPYFYYYEEDLLQIFLKEYKFLKDLNLGTQEVIKKHIPLNCEISFTSEYHPQINNDFRMLIHPKKNSIAVNPRYIQVFEERHGFIPNLSILDLLFNEGPMAESYLNFDL